MDLFPFKTAKTQIHSCILTKKIHPNILKLNVECAKRHHHCQRSCHPLGKSLVLEDVEWMEVDEVATNLPNCFSYVVTDLWM